MRCGTVRCSVVSTEVSLKTHQMCSSTPRLRNLSPVCLDLCLRKSKTGKSNANHDYILKRKTGVSNFPGLKSVFKKFRSIEG